MPLREVVQNRLFSWVSEVETLPICLGRVDLAGFYDALAPVAGERVAEGRGEVVVVGFNNSPRTRWFPALTLVRFVRCSGQAFSLR